MKYLAFQAEITGKWKHEATLAPLQEIFLSDGHHIEIFSAVVSRVRS